MNAWLYIGLFLVIALALPAAAILISYILGPKKPDAIKRSVYECGIETVGDTWVQFKAQYYIFGLVFWCSTWKQSSSTRGRLPTTS